MCRGLHGTHRRAKEAMRSEVRTQIEAAQRELKRLEGLYEEVAWYNFEAGRGWTWRRPWKGKVSPGLTLCAYRIYEVQRNGRSYEVGEFPVWYQGPTISAPVLPPEIIATEVELAHEYLTGLRVALTDIDDWAPGGALYNELVESEPLRILEPPKSRRKSSKHTTKASDGHPL